MAYADGTKMTQTFRKNHSYLKYWYNKFFIKHILRAKKEEKNHGVGLDEWTD